MNSEQYLTKTTIRIKFIQHNKALTPGVRAVIIESETEKGLCVNFWITAHNRIAPKDDFKHELLFIIINCVVNKILSGWWLAVHIK